MKKPMQTKLPFGEAATLPSSTSKSAPLETFRPKRSTPPIQVQLATPDPTRRLRTRQAKPTDLVFIPKPETTSRTTLTQQLGHQDPTSSYSAVLNKYPAVMSRIFVNLTAHRDGAVDVEASEQLCIFYPTYHRWRNKLFHLGLVVSSDERRDTPSGDSVVWVTRENFLRRRQSDTQGDPTPPGDIQPAPPGPGPKKDATPKLGRNGAHVGRINIPKFTQRTRRPPAISGNRGRAR